MDWDDVEDVLFYGSAEEIEKVRCPDCRSKLEYEYYPTTNSYKVRCASCGVVILGHGCHKVPNFAAL